MIAILAKSISKLYGKVTAVNKVDLQVNAGEIFGFLGPNGAGKSTTIKIFTTLIKPTSGSLQILGINALKNPLEIRKKIGVVLQQPSYEPSLSVERSLDTYGMMWNVPKNIRKTRISQLLSDFDLQNIKAKKMEDLSIGQRRRVQVAREFIHDMELLFLDEPTVGLDPAARRKLLDFLKQKAHKGLTIFYTTHVLSEAEYLCNKIAIINKGKIITVNTPDELKKLFGKEKTIKIHLSKIQNNIPFLLSGIKDCKIEFNNGTDITIFSQESEKILAKILLILNQYKIEIENLSAVPTNLEDIFLEVVKDASNY